MRSRPCGEMKYPRVYAGRPLSLPGMENVCEGGPGCQPAEGGETTTVVDRKKAQGERRLR